MKPSQHLRDEVDLLKLVYHRNKNQHKNQAWWKYFSIFLRRASQLAKSNKLDPATAKFLDRKLVPQLWRALHSALAQGAFLTITFTAMAGVARIAELIRPAVPVKAHQKLSSDHKIKFELQEDLGEEISEVYLEEVSTQPGLISTNTQASSASMSSQYGKGAPKKSKLTGKSSQINAIDDIFGPSSSSAREHGREKTKKSSKKKKTDAIDAIFG